MVDLFHKALVLSETVIGSLLDTRSIVLYEQPPIDMQQLRLNNIGTDTQIIDEYLQTQELTELFTGTPIPYLSKINGFNMFGATYLRAEVGISSDLCQHPIETGQVVTDASIINPVTATVRIAVPTAFYTQIYEQIATLFREKKYIMMQTKFALYRNMVVVAMPYVLEHENVDRVPIDIKLEQVMEIIPQYKSANGGPNSISPKKAGNATDSDTAELGRVTANTPAQGA